MDLWTPESPLFMGFSTKEYWVVAMSVSRNLSNPRIKTALYVLLHWASSFPLPPAPPPPWCLTWRHVQKLSLENPRTSVSRNKGEREKLGMRLDESDTDTKIHAGRPHLGEVFEMENDEHTWVQSDLDLQSLQDRVAREGVINWELWLDPAHRQK